MPTVKKQVAPSQVKPALKPLSTVTTPPKKGMSAPKAEPSIWDEVVDVTDHDSGGIHVSLYGRGKTGKTRFICTFPKPILIIGAEDGTKSVKGIKGVKFIRIRRCDQLGELVAGAIARGYATVALDTASQFADMVLEEVTGVRVPEQKSWGLFTREQYGQQAAQMKSHLRPLLDLPCHVVITAHEKNLISDEGHQDLMVPSVGSALGKSTVGWLNGAVDYICQTFIRKAMREIVMELGGEKQSIMELIPGAKPEFCLRCGPHPVYQTGFRLTPGFELPEIIVSPDFDKIMAVIEGKYKA